MNEQQQRFVDAYLITPVATQAAITAGYSEKTAYSQGQRLLKHVEVAEAIANDRQERTQKAKIDAQWVLDQAVGATEDARKDGAHSAASSLIKLVGQHVDVQALVDKREVSNRHSYEEMTDEQLEAELAKRQS